MAILGAFAVPHPPLIIPEVGRGDEAAVEETTQAYDEVMKQAAGLGPDVAVIISPHSVMYGDYLHISPGEHASGSFSQYGAGQVRVDAQYDSAFARALASSAAQAELPAGFLGEKEKALDHGTMIPLYFMQKYLPDIKIVRLSISGLSFAQHYEMGMLITQVAKAMNRKAVVIASGDLSHRLKADGPYGFAKEGPQFDEHIVHVFKTGDFLDLLKMDADFCDSAGECGLRAFIVMAGTLDGKDVRAELLSYQGPFGVGYAVASFIPRGEDQKRKFLQQWREIDKQAAQRRKEGEDDFVRLARYTLENYIKTGKMPPRPEGLPAELTERRAGVFVSLKKDGNLRGCIGTISPTQDSIAAEIMHNAISAGTGDYRFSPVTKAELPTLVYSVDVLGEAQPIKSMAELDVRRYGVIVSSGGRRGLLLPDLSGVDTPKQQVEIALQKAGISPGEAYEMERFEVIRHK